MCVQIQGYTQNGKNNKLRVKRNRDVTCDANHAAQQYATQHCCQVSIEVTELIHISYRL